jgi:hypothetical protein
MCTIVLEQLPNIIELTDALTGDAMQNIEQLPNNLEI